MDEPDDYMSDQFLAISNDTRPGLIKDRSKQREYNLFKRKKEMDKDNKSVHKNLAMDRLHEGLEQPLGPENKGFSMLQKMGFKPGTCLGTTQSGLIEPISVNLKSDRQGLGRDRAIRELRLKKKSIRAKAKESCNVEEFRSELSRKYREKEILVDLSKSQKTCFKLDTDANISNPVEPWFWPDHMLSCNNSDEEEKDDSTSEIETFNFEEKLEMLTVYLRGCYTYCIWCGVQYNGEDDLNSSCPGTTRDDH